MTAIILIPALACWAVLAMGSARKALLWVYFPTLLLLPQDYVFYVPHLPPINFADAAILPLGMALVLEMRRWRWAWMDLWVLLFAMCAGLSEALSTELANGDWTQLFSANFAESKRLGTLIANGGLMLASGILTMVLPYMAGKLLIEQQHGTMRKKVAACIVVLLAVVAGLSIYDFLTGRSLWLELGKPLLRAHQSMWVPQMRWGFGRIAGPYGHAILAGMVFLIGLVYCLWLRSADRTWGSRRLIAGLPFTVRGLSLAAIVAGLLMTQSRGPWIGVGLALIFVLLTRYLPVAKAAIAFAGFCIVFTAGALYYANHYTERAMGQASSVEQRNAIYRRQLLTSYAPIVMQRKAFGWGITTAPVANGQVSIDNEYLSIAVREGFTGLAVFLAILAGSAAKLLRMISQPIPSEDRMLAFAHLAVLIGLMTTLATVYLGEQVVMLFFLFTGWVQAMHPAVERVPLVKPLAPQIGFRRVLV